MPGDDDLLDRLAGGRRQSLGKSDAVAALVGHHPERATELWSALDVSDPVVRLRAVDALEKVSAAHPEVLRGHEPDILHELPASDLAEVRWHVGLLIPRLRLSAAELAVAVQVLRRQRQDPSAIVQVNALDGLVRLAAQHPELAGAASAALTQALESPHPSVRARARRLVREAPPL